MKTQRTISNPDKIGLFDMKLNFIWLLTGLLLSGLLSMTSISLAGGDTWVKKADMPTARNSFAVAVVDGKIYTFGGRIKAFDNLDTVEVYDPATDKWTKKSPMPTPRRGAMAAVVDGKIYVIGGLQGDFAIAGGELAVVEIYDPATDKWTKKANLLSARGFGAAEVVQGKIYVIGGFAEARYISFVEEYNPATDKWRVRTGMPFNNSHFGSGVVDDIIYVVGGVGVGNAVARYYPPADAWSTGHRMPTFRSAHGVAVVDGNLYAIGGNPALANVEKYYPDTNTWTKKTVAMPTGRSGIGVAVVNGKIYVMGGATSSPWQDPVEVLATVEEYTPGEGNEEPFAVSPRGKLATMWGEVKRGK